MKHNAEYEYRMSQRLNDLGFRLDRANGTLYHFGRNSRIFAWILLHYYSYKYHLLEKNLDSKVDIIIIFPSESIDVHN